MKNKTLIISIMAFVFALLISLLILLLLGKNPITFVITLFTVFFNDKNGTLMTSFLLRIVPLTFSALGVAFAFRTGLFNIGAEGQVSMGIFGAALVGTIPGIPTGLHLILVVLSGFIFGALWGLIPGIFRAYFEVHEVVITIMMNYIALELLKGVFLPMIADANGHQVKAMQASATLSTAFGDAKFLGVALNYWLFLVIALLAVALYHFIINKTVFGFELRAGGLNEHGAKYAGMKSKRNIMLSMAISGGFAGVGGAFYTLAGTIVSVAGFSHTGYGFDGMAAALLGGSTAVGSLIGSSILSYLGAVNTKIQQLVGVPKEITEMIVALILFFIAMSYAFELIMKHLNNKKAKAIKTEEEQV